MTWKILNRFTGAVMKEGEGNLGVQIEGGVATHEEQAQFMLDRRGGKVQMDADRGKWLK